MLSPLTHLITFLLLSSLALLPASAAFVPLCDPIIDMLLPHENASCLRVDVINAPQHESDFGHCICRFLITAPGGSRIGARVYPVGAHGDLTLEHLVSCSFGEESSVAAHPNPCKVINRGYTIPPPVLRELGSEVH